MNDKYSSSDDVAPLFYTSQVSYTAFGVLSKNPLMTARSKSLYGIKEKVFSPIKPLISILESSMDD